MRAQATQLENEQKVWRILHQRRYTDGKEVHEKLFNTISQGNALIAKHNIATHLSEWRNQ